MSEPVQDDSLVGRFSALWDESEASPDVFQFLEQHADASARDCADVVLLDQSRRHEHDSRLAVEEYLAQLPRVALVEELKLELIVEEFSRRQDGANPPDIEQFLERFPELHEPLLRILSSPIRQRRDGEVLPTVTMPYGTHASGDTSVSSVPTPPPRDKPERIDRYRIERLLGEGGCGTVYLAVDEELQRHVAVKVPRRYRVEQPETIDEFFKEARVLASLDHAAIVPVYDVGRTDEGWCYVVSKFIEGTDLAGKLTHEPLSFLASAELIAEIADALHYAHQRGLVHRDVKPGNILLDHEGNPFLTDFGLALKDEDYGTGPEFSGTIAYMSPEQARGEGHLVDGRSDIFSLGIVLYRLLVGARPFRGETHREVTERIIKVEPRPPRQLNDSIPKELERICLKALAKRVSDRYTTAKDLASELRTFVEQHRLLGESAVGRPHLDQSDVGSVSGISSRHSYTETSAAVIAIVPKGLRSFDDDDADFFLELLPGPRDREGLPDSLRFWKRRIEEPDPDSTFRVGLLYGPSGCGKSSLVKAGLLPRLADTVTAIFVEATPDDTETRLLRGLRKHCPELPVGLSLTEAISTLRRESRVRPQRKVLLVLDQFEQWLHTRNDESNELVAALRQCDAEHIQCLLLVRDDFWMSITRLLRELEVPLQEGHNCAAVDRFDQRHARRVLRLYGQAFGTMPASRQDLTKDQRSFLEQSVDGLAEEGKVIPVRLALFAEMIKDKPWTTATLKAVGGAKGVGVAFLEETFSSSSAPPQHRIHQRAARAVLKTLLPEHGAGIKGASRSHHELLEASGYARRTREFDDLLHILSQELRILTPIDPEGLDDESVAAPSDETFYQLTHDFLVPALQRWLVRKQQETREGRAELRLAERAALWNAKPEPQQLPTLWEWLSVRRLTQRRDWTDPQRKMMRVAARRHVSRAALAMLFVMLLTASGLMVRQQVIQRQNARHADALVARLLDAETAEVPNIVAEFKPFLVWTTPRLRGVLDDEDERSKTKLHASLALLPEDAGQVEFLLDRVRTAGPEELATIRQMVRSHHDAATAKLWKVAAGQNHGKEEQFRAACMLAEYDPANEQWSAVAELVANHLVSEPPLAAAQWAEALQGVCESLVATLAAIFRDADRAGTERTIAAEVLADYAADDPELLIALLLDATPQQFAVLLPKLNAHYERAVSLLEAEVNRVAEPTWPAFPNGNWPAADASIVRQIDRATGMITPHFALCQTLPVGEFDEVVAKLETAGYRLSRLRPYSTSSGVQVAALWQRDGLATDYVLDQAPEQLRDRNEQQRERGYLPADVAAYSATSGESDPANQYAALWVRGDTRCIDAKMYVVVPNEEHADHWGPLNAASFVPLADLVTLDSQGQPLFSSVRWKFAVYPWYLPRTSTAAEHRTIADNGWYQADVRLVADAETNEGYKLAGMWWPGVKYVSTALNGFAPHRHLRPCQELADTGFRPHALSVISLGENEVVTASVWQRPAVLDEDKDALSRRQANAAIALAGLESPEQLWPKLQHDGEPYLRSHLIHRLQPLGVDLDVLAKRLADEPDESIRRALLLALSEYSRDTIPAAQRTNLIAQFLDLHRNDPNPGVHSAAEFALRCWGAEEVVAEINSALREEPAESSVRWYVTSEGHTMAVVSADHEWKMGSLGHERNRVHHMELRHSRRLGRKIAASTKEITVEQFLRFLPEYDFARNYSLDPSCPINMVTWFDAARYCRWLSEQEGIAEEQMCYPAPKEIKPGMRLPENFLKRTGYRLPTEAEWEFLCRGGTSTSRYYGVSAKLLSEYAYTAQNSDYQAWPVGRLFPNDFGLFDTLGNMYEWCHEADRPYSPPPFGADGPGDRQESSEITDAESRVMRGGSFLYQPSNARAAHRDRQLPSRRTPYVGFRIVRTIAASPSD
jgi:hypothetical protein